jgi:hypothetical protein
MRTEETHYITYIPSEGMALKWTSPSIGGVRYTDKDITLAFGAGDTVEECPIEEMKEHPELALHRTIKLSFKERVRYIWFNVLLVVSPKSAMKLLDRSAAKMEKLKKNC